MPDYCCPRKADGGCGRIRITALPLEAFIRDLVLTHAADPAVRRALETTGTHRAELERPDSHLRRLERRADQLAADYGAGALGRRAYTTASTSNDLEHETTQRRVETLLTSSTPVLADAPRTAVALERWWDASTDPMRRALIDAVIERIDIGWSPAGRADSRPTA